MGNTRIGSSPTLQPQSLTTDTPVENAASNSPSPQSPVKDVDRDSAARTAGAFKQLGNEARSQQEMQAQMTRRGLEKQIGKSPDGKITFDSQAGNDKLAQIHVKRQVETTPPKPKMIMEYTGNRKMPDMVVGSYESGSERVKTQFPNGVSVQVNSTIEPNGDRFLTSVSIQPPPGGKITENKDGSSSILDANGKEVGTLTGGIGKDGNLTATVHVHTKNGEYTQTADGQITFTPKGKK